jgi:hypothetical protein
MTMGVRIGFLAVLASGVVLLALNHFNNGKEVPSPADNAGLRVLQAFQDAESSSVGIATRLAGIAEKRAELLSAAFQAAPVEAIDPLLRAAAWAKHRAGLLSIRACTGNDWPDLVTYCDADRANPLARKVQTFSLGTAPHERESVRAAMRQLDGKWKGDGFVLEVDSARAQAKVDPTLPFQWDRYGIKTISDGMVVFAVGAELYEASVDAESIILSSTGFRGKRRLGRQTVH